MKNIVTVFMLKLLRDYTCLRNTMASCTMLAVGWGTGQQQRINQERRAALFRWAIARGERVVAAAYDQSAICAALAMSNPAMSSYLDLVSGSVVTMDDTATDPATETLRNEVMEGYGDRYRYIPGGNAAADDTAVAQWLEAEGL